ncbi:MAG: Crp/Fnr family transcriptional regulator [Rhodospirillales bacterium]|nr:Crp/Fnr family transcriptional regulator [Rhodospirillales bacterium]
MANTKNLFDPSVRTLSHINLLAEAPPEKIAELEASCEWLEFEADEIVVNLKDESTNAFFVVKGKLRAMDFLTEDEEVALAELVEGYSFGELSAIDLKVRSARVTAIEPTLLASVSSKDFRKLLFDCPGVAMHLLKTFAGFIRTLNTRITALSIMSPHQRIYHELLRISEPNTGGDGSWIIQHVPHHSEIATWVGAEKQTVAEAIGGLARDGIIERKHGSLHIKDRARLQRLASQ